MLITVFETLHYRGDVVCHDNKAGPVQRILGNSYGQLIYGDMWKSQFPYRFCNKDHEHPEYGRVLTGNSDGKWFLFVHFLKKNSGNHYTIVTKLKMQLKSVTMMELWWVYF